MDKVMAKRINWKVTPKSSATVIKALSIFKRKASQARRNTLEKEANGTMKAQVSGHVEQEIPRQLTREETISKGKLLLG